MIRPKPRKRPPADPDEPKAVRPYTCDGCGFYVSLRPCAICAAIRAKRVREHYAEAAKERMEAGAKHGGETAGKGRPKQDDSPGAKRAEGYRQQQSRASEQAGAALNVSRRSVDRARVVQGEGVVPELAKKVEAGEMSLSKAAAWTPTSCSRSHLHHGHAGRGFSCPRPVSC